TLNGPIGHAGGDNGANTADDADTVTVKVKDVHGNTFDVQVKVDIVDDVPTFGVHTDTTMSNEVGTATGDLVFDTGADAVGASHVITSIDGLPPGWAVSGLGTEVGVIKDTNGTPIFEVTLNADNATYTVKQLAERPGTTD